MSDVVAPGDRGHSGRASLADEQISRRIDLSMGRIGVPAEQGGRDARQAMA